MDKEFNPNDPGAADSNIFGLPYTADEADLVLLPMPWEATVSYGAGTAAGPAAIFEASKQIDLFHPELEKVWLYKTSMLPVNEKIASLSNNTRNLVEKIIEQIVNGDEINAEELASVNLASADMIAYAENICTEWLQKGKSVAMIGGDHSTPLGLLKALAKKHTSFGVLQFDAHCDLRKAFEGFTYSHASIMYNVLNEVPAVSQLTQVGIRDFCAEEIDFIAANKNRVTVFFDRDNQYQKIEGSTWKTICVKIVETLPAEVFISFDIDGLSPELCPNTGTPVPGGMTFHEATYLIDLVAKKRKIIGFDLNEVSPSENDEWDANVGARLLFQLCCAYRISQQLSQ